MLAIGSRIQLHPATDQWMVGDRFGEIVSATVIPDRFDAQTGEWIKPRIKYKVLMDKSGRTMTVKEENVNPVD